MAVVDIKLAAVINRSIYNNPAPAIDAVYIDTDFITLSGTSQQSDFSVPTNAAGLFWVLTVSGGNIRALFGSDPTAAATEDGGWLILDGQTRIFSATGGHKVAVISQG